MGHGMRTNGTCNWSGKKYTSTEINNNIQTKKKPIGLKKKHEEGMVDGFTQICRTAQELTSVQINSNEVLNPTQQLCPACNSRSLHTDLNYPNPSTAQAGKEFDGPHEFTGRFLALLRPENLTEACGGNQATKLR